MQSVVAICITLTGLGASDVWFETSLKPVLEAAAGENATSSDVGKIYAARGEWESFQLWITAGRKGLENVRIEGEPFVDGAPRPEVRSIAGITLRSAGGEQVADPLVPVAPVSLERDRGTGFWITYYIPPETPPGIYESALHIFADNQRTRRLPVRIEVFGFTLPNTPTLPALFHLDRAALERVYELPKRDLESWQRFYDALAGYHVSYSVWDGGALAPVSPSGQADVRDFKNHLEYILRGNSMAAIEIAGQGKAFTRFPQPAPGTPQDPLQFYFFDMMAWLQERGLQDRAVAEPIQVRERSDWQTARDALFRCRLADKRVPRLLAAPPHPYFERYTERYAFPYQAYDPLLLQRMKQGISLEQTPPNPASVHASGAGAMASAVDAYDGSLHTAWSSAQTPTERQPAWIQLDFQKPIDLAEFAIVWETGYETRDIVVSTAFPGNPPGTATVEWDHQIVQGDFVQNRSSAVMKFVKKTNLLRLEFRSPSPKGSIGVSEIIIGAGDYSRLDDVSGLAPWLDINQGGFPAPIAGSPPVVARTAPWLCWTTGFEGIYGGGLNDWPRSWNITSANFAFDTADESLHALVYPLQDTLAPSIRLARLRDGLEDYEYLVALKAASRNTLPEDPALAGLLKPQVFPMAPRQEDLAALAARIEDIRVRIGRWLTELEETP